MRRMNQIPARAASPSTNPVSNSDTIAGVKPGNGVGQQQREIGGIATTGDSLFNSQICPNEWGHLSQGLRNARAGSIRARRSVCPITISAANPSVKPITTRKYAGESAIR